MLKNKSNLILHIEERLHELILHQQIFSHFDIEWKSAAGVLMLLGLQPGAAQTEDRPCLFLNKRSMKVKQPGDLCFPGGRMVPVIDPCLSHLFASPVTSLGRWQRRTGLEKKRSPFFKLVSIIWAAGLRESFEEMKLNPFGVRFLGALPSQSLVMFKRTIYPMVGWINRQKRFFPNWEVEKVVHVPLEDLLNPKYYGCYRLQFGKNPDQPPPALTQDYPCFRLQAPHNQEILWGATYRITLGFLKLVCGFEPPALETLPVVEGVLDETYLTGQK
jgi:hypothetical protein